MNRVTCITLLAAFCASPVLLLQPVARADELPSHFENGRWVQSPIPSEVFSGVETILYDPGTGEYSYEVNGARDGTAFSYGGFFDLADPDNPVRVPLLPESLPGEHASDGYYFIRVLDNPLIHEILLGDGFPAGVWTDSVTVELDVATGDASGSVAAPGGLTRTPGIVVTTRKWDALVVIFDGEEYAFGKAVEQLRARGIDSKNIQAWLNRELNAREFRNLLEDGARRRLAESGLNEAQVAELKLLHQDAEADNDQYFADARERLAEWGVSVGAIADLAPEDGSGPLLFGGDDPDITVGLEVEIAVSIPPFVTVTVGAYVSMTGPLSTYAEMAALVRAKAQALAQELADETKK